MSSLSRTDVLTTAEIQATITEIHTNDLSNKPESTQAMHEISKFLLNKDYDINDVELNLINVTERNCTYKNPKCESQHLKKISFQIWEVEILRLSDSTCTTFKTSEEPNYELLCTDSIMELGKSINEIKQSTITIHKIK